jgi:anaerobic glycerol-3-phosphate dehydrogenase
MLRPHQLFKILPIAFAVITGFDAIAQQSGNEMSIEVTADKVSEAIRILHHKHH